MANERSLEQRVARLEAKDEIRELCARYNHAVDDRDIDTLGTLFCADGRFRSRDGVMDALGRDSVIEQFHGRFAAIGPSNHIQHDLIITFDEDRDNRGGGDGPSAASGLINSHAEVWRGGSMMIAALRYEDRYRVEDGRWRFEDRLLSFMYYLPVQDYAEAMGGVERMRAYGDRRPADYPEGLASWRKYYGDD